MPFASHAKGWKNGIDFGLDPKGEHLEQLVRSRANPAAARELLGSGQVEIARFDIEDGTLYGNVIYAAF